MACFTPENNAYCLPNVNAFLNNDYVGGGFSSYPAFRHRSTWCPERNRDLILEAYISMLEKKDFF